MAGLQAASDAVHADIATKVQEAEALLIFTGAGMGVDSGLGTFRGRHAGVWPPLKTMGLSYNDMAEPEWFVTDPGLAWAFWSFCFNAYSTSTPHAGYSILAKWGHRMPHGLFSVTSNIDGHWARTDGVRQEEVLEIHGSLQYVQSLQRDGELWPMDPHEIASLRLPDFDLQAGETVEVQLLSDPYNAEAEWLEATTVEDKEGGIVIISSETGKQITVQAVRRVGGQDLMRISEECPLICDSKGQLARPNVMMFQDLNMNRCREQQQQEAYDNWLTRLPANSKLLIVEVGAGTAVSTIRNMSTNAFKQFQNATLVRINLEEGGANSKGVISVPQGALAALSKVDAHIAP